MGYTVILSEWENIVQMDCGMDMQLEELSLFTGLSEDEIIDKAMKVIDVMPNN